MIDLELVELPSFQKRLGQVIQRVDPQNIVAIERRGARLLEVLLRNSPELREYIPRLVYQSAIPYIPPAQLQRRKLLVVDDVSNSGRSLSTTVNRLGALGCDVTPFAIAASNEEDAVRSRESLDLDGLECCEQVSPSDYQLFTSSISRYLQCQPRPKNVDSTTFALRYGEGDLYRLYGQFLHKLREWGPVTELNYSGFPTDQRAITLHWPNFFEAPLESSNARASLAGVVKIRMYVNFTNDTILCVPMVYPDVEFPFGARTFLSDGSRIPLLDGLLSNARANLESLKDLDEITLLAYDCLGFYYDVVLFRQLLDKLSQSDLKPIEVTLDKSEVEQYYGWCVSHSISNLVEGWVNGNYDDEGQVPSQTMCPQVEDFEYAPTESLAIVARTIAKHLRDGFTNLNRGKALSERRNFGLSLRSIISSLKLDWLSASIVLDFLNDSFVVAPYNALIGTNSVSRHYRTTEIEIDPDMVIGICIDHLCRGCPPLRDGIPNTVLAKSMAILIDFFESCPSDRLVTYPAKYGQLVGIKGKSVFDDSESWTQSILDFPSTYYEKNLEGRFVASTKLEKFVSTGKLQLSNSELKELQADLDAIGKLYELSPKSDSLTLWSLLAADSFGFFNLTSNIESACNRIEPILNAMSTGKKTIRKAGSEHPLINISKDSIADLALARKKLTLLRQSSDLLSDSRSKLNSRRASEREVLTRMQPIPPDSPLLELFSQLIYLLRVSVESIQALLTDPDASRENEKSVAKTYGLLRSANEILDHLEGISRQSGIGPEENHYDLIRSEWQLLWSRAFSWLSVLNNRTADTSDIAPTSYMCGPEVFVDLSGSTTSSQKLKIDRYLRTTNAALSTIHNWYSLFHITARKSAGDAVFGSVASPLSALRIGSLIKIHFDLIRSILGEDTLPCKVSAHLGSFGPIIAGDQGGDALNVSERISKFARGTDKGFLISSELAAVVPKEFQSALGPGFSVEISDIDKAHKVHSVDPHKIVLDFVEDFRNTVQRHGSQQLELIDRPPSF